MPDNVSDGKTSEKVPWWRKLPIEDTVITAAVILGLGVGAFLSVCRTVPPITSGFFIGVGVVALIYRYLGGISQDTKVTIIGIKLTGVVAVLVGVAFIFNHFLEKQHRLIPRESLTLSFYKNSRPFKEKGRILVKTNKGSIDMQDSGEFILPLKDFESADGTISIDWQPKEEISVEKNIPEVKYKSDPPGITLTLDFLDKIDVPKNATLTFRKRNKLLDEREKITVKADTTPIEMTDKGEFILPFKHLERTEGRIFIDWTPEEDTGIEPLSIFLQYKINPPGITLHLDDLAKKRQGNKP
jgi:hypothetical protein